ncbi:hypothetical protein GJAV_G00218680 [Gymnothorax javanicus]|nr:hypothetical protein GJAV_G00218680 [Gymnothorax javanicus]
MDFDLIPADVVRMWRSNLRLRPVQLVVQVCPFVLCGGLGVADLVSTLLPPNQAHLLLIYNDCLNLKLRPATLTSLPAMLSPLSVLPCSLFGTPFHLQ